LIGMPNKTVAVPGSVVPLPKASVKARMQAQPQSWDRFIVGCPAIRGCAPPAPDDGQYFHLLSTTATSGDVIKVGEDVLTHDHQFAQVQAIFGRVSGSNQRTYFVAARLYTLDSLKHATLDLPVLIRSQSVVCIAVEDLLCAVNLQHDCARCCACTNTRAVYSVQEREQTTRISYRVRHSDDDYYILNLHAFHNAQIIQKALPAHLYALRPQATDTEAIFTSAVEKLNIAKLQKVRLAAAKRAAKGVMEEAMEEAAGHMGGGKEDDDAPTDADALLPQPKGATKRKAQGNNGATTSTRKQKGNMGVLSDDDEDLDFEEDVLPPRARHQPSRSHTNGPNTQHRAGSTHDIVAFTKACCEEFELTDALKNDAMKCAQMPLQHLLIRTYTRVLSFGQHVKYSNVSSFLNSNIFKEHITRRLQCSLLDPNLLFYVKGTTARFV
ncbi:hypothetical protein FRC06_010941, partial [Ceratobasidium sp. 370]